MSQKSKTDARKELADLEADYAAKKAELEKILAEPEVDPREWIGKLCWFWESYELFEKSRIKLFLGKDESGGYFDCSGNSWANCRPVTLADLEGKIYQPKKTRYDWSRKDIPEWVRYWTTDESGHEDWWSQYPGMKTEGWFKYSGNVNTATLSGTPCPDWRDSLEEKPEGVW